MDQSESAPQGAKRDLQRKGGIGVRDLVTVAVSTVIYVIIFYLCAFTGYIPIMSFLFPLPIALLTGIPQMLFFTKVRSVWMAPLMGALLGLLFMLQGQGPYGLVFGVGFGLVAGLILRAGNYRSTLGAVAAHSVFSLWVIGTMLPMWIMGQAYFEPYRASQGDAYVNEMIELLSGGMLVIIVVGILVCAIVGALVGRVIMKKHFERAGVA